MPSPLWPALRQRNSDEYCLASQHSRRSCRRPRSLQPGSFHLHPVNAAVVTIDVGWQPPISPDWPPSPQPSPMSAPRIFLHLPAGYHLLDDLSTSSPAEVTMEPGSVTPGTPVPLTTVITDTQGNQITGVSSTIPLPTCSRSPLLPAGLSPQPFLRLPPSPPFATRRHATLPSLDRPARQWNPCSSNSVRITSTGRSSTFFGWPARNPTSSNQSTSPRGPSAHPSSSPLHSQLHGARSVGQQPLLRELS